MVFIQIFVSCILAKESVIVIQSIAEEVGNGMSYTLLQLDSFRKQTVVSSVFKMYYFSLNVLLAKVSGNVSV